MKSEKQLLCDIKKQLEIVHEQNYKKRSEWTKAFKIALTNICPNDYKVYSSLTHKKIYKEKGNGEWLFDLIWSKEGKKKNEWQKNYKGLHLFCECEWDQKIEEILYDFQKLAVAKAKIKIMIVQYGKKIIFGNILELCKKSIDDSLLNDGSIYILVGSGNNGDGLQFQPLVSCK